MVTTKHQQQSPSRERKRQKRICQSVGDTEVYVPSDPSPTHLHSIPFSFGRASQSILSPMVIGPELIGVFGPFFTGFRGVS